MSGFGMLTDTNSIPSKPKINELFYIKTRFCFSGSFIIIRQSENTVVLNLLVSVCGNGSGAKSADNLHSNTSTAAALLKYYSTTQVQALLLKKNCTVLVSGHSHLVRPESQVQCSFGRCYRHPGWNSQCGYFPLR